MSELPLCSLQVTALSCVQARHGARAWSPLGTWPSPPRVFGNNGGVLNGDEGGGLNGDEVEWAGLIRGGGNGDGQL